MYLCGDYPSVFILVRDAAARGAGEELEVLTMTYNEETLDRRIMLRYRYLPTYQSVLWIQIISMRIQSIFKRIKNIFMRIQSIFMRIMSIFMPIHSIG